MASSAEILPVDASALIEQLCVRARAAQRETARLDCVAKSAALRSAAEAIRSGADSILAANRKDLDTAKSAGLSAAMLDRLALDAERLVAVAKAIDNVAGLTDPVGETIDRVEQSNGLEMSRIRIPIGLIGIIYESRPNVTADAAALGFKSGNAVLLRGGSEAVHSNQAIHAAFARGLEDAGVNPDVVQLVPTQDRSAVGAMLAAHGLIDMIIPRGGKGLVARVQQDARVPVLAHLDGICHTYVHHAADTSKASEIALNAKMRRTGICGAMETLLIDAKFPDTANLVARLIDAGCEVRGDRRACAIDSRIIAAGKEDWDTEYLAAVLSVRIVDGIDAALDHIAEHSSAHTDAIVSEDAVAAERFLAEVDSAIVMHNTSSQFADGGEFGLGAEIGIATGRLHARGPVALEGLTTYKWQVRGSGQVRP